MKKLKELIKEMEKTNSKATRDNPYPYVSIEEIKKIADETRPFVFSDVIGWPDHEDECSIDLPFASISIEVAGDKNLGQTDPFKVLLNQITHKKAYEGYSQQEIICMRVFELSSDPTAYGFMVLIKTPKGKQVMFFNTVTQPDLAPHFMSLTKQYLKMIQKEKVGLAEGSPIRLNILFTSLFVWLLSE